jgi:hypothetical protein
MGMVEKGEMVGNAGTESLELIHSPESRKGTLRTVGFHSSILNFLQKFLDKNLSIF